MHEIIPGILEKDWSAIEEKFKQIRSFAKTVHIDLIDGKFASNTTFLDPQPFVQYSKDFFLELHLMVEDPIDYLEPFAKAGFRRFLGHIEKMPDQIAFLAKAEHLGEVGLAVDGPTPLDLLQVSLADLDALLLFTGGKAGFSGQPFAKNRLDKVKALHTKEPFLPLTVDGGTTLISIPHSSHAGAVRFIATSALFTSNNPEAAYHALLTAATSAQSEGA